MNSPSLSHFDALLGQHSVWSVLALTAAGASLRQKGAADRGQPTLTLPHAELPEHTRIGDEITVFIYLDSAGKPTATTRSVKLVRGQVTFLTVSAITDVGAFVDWGLPKELLVPFAEQTSPLRVGQRQPIGLYLDKSGRLSGTMRVNPLLNAGRLQLAQDQWVDGEAWRNDPEIGLFVILKKTGVGLVPRHEPHPLTRGETARFRVAEILPDGKISLSLRALAHEQLDLDAERLLALLQGPNPPKLGDHSPPDQVRRLLGLSKKAFKRAVGSLLRQRRVQLDAAGHVRVVSAAPVERG